MNIDVSSLSADSTVKEAVEIWYYSFKENFDEKQLHQSKKYISAARASIVHFINPLIGSIGIAELTHEDLVDFCCSVLWEGSKFSTLQHILYTLYKTYEMLQENSIISENIVSNHFLNRGRYSKNAEQAEITENHVISFLRLAQNDLYRALFCLIMFTEIRPDECICLKVKDIDPEYNVLHISRRCLDSNSNHITVPVFYRDLRKLEMPDELMLMLRKQLTYNLRASMMGGKNICSQDSYVFLNSTGDPLSIGTMYSHARGYLFMIGLPDSGFSELIKAARKTGITPAIKAVIDDMLLCPPYKKVFVPTKKGKKDLLK